MGASYRCNTTISSNEHIDNNDVKLNRQLNKTPIIRHSCNIHSNSNCCNINKSSSNSSCKQHQQQQLRHQQQQLQHQQQQLQHQQQQLQRQQHQQQQMDSDLELNKKAGAAATGGGGGITTPPPPVIPVKADNAYHGQIRFQKME
ncbi:hypothetical protein HELRODRAFT_163270 [Helobdella robusta]|uniref:Uncharacterized protein n=1 Tax=Helobdella robusta TaxID=6412 RepID=T1ETV0_HELRO|nr:hypothetical protein HELRODRAFT_163270 [Helobdella robusta]ESN96227.1 hypothetical protein HELRODRAFT_163270 [Helobdella robusta]